MSVQLIQISKVFDDLSKQGIYVQAVNKVDLEVKEGEFVTLLGPSGCGKTTTLRIISGFEKPTDGDVLIGGIRVNDQAPNKRDTSMVFQSYAIFPHMSVEQNVGFGLELKGRSKSEIKGETAKIMEIMGLASMAKRRPDQLSGGQQQRVALARAIINKPKVLLFDEPLSNLDAKLRDQMRLEIRRIQQRFGITSIYVTHDQIEAMTVSDRIVVMNNGRVMQIGTPFEIYSRPANCFVADFIGRVNFFHGERTRYSEKGVVVDFRGVSMEAATRNSNLRETKPAIIAVRPEALQIQRTADAKKYYMRGRIEKAVYLGSVVEYEIDAGMERPIMAISYNPAVSGFFDVGDVVAIDFPAKAAHAIAPD